MTLAIREQHSDPDGIHAQLIEGPNTAESSGLMGPPIVLHRGEPVEITVENQMQQETAIHWHGIELESYYEGVPEFSGMGSQVTPPILSCRATSLWSGLHPRGPARLFITPTGMM